MDSSKSQQKISDSTDAELAAEYGLNRSEAVLSELFARYKRPFYAYFNKMLNNDTMSADDLFQELWVKIAHKLHECRNKENFSSWAFAIAHNLVMGHYRTQKRRRKVGIETRDGRLPDSASTETEIFSDEYRDYRISRLNDAINALPQEQKEVVELRRRGVSFNDIADIQKCPLNTALSRMHKAVKFLRTILKDAE